MQRDYKYNNTVSKAGIYTLHLNAELNKQISEYCKMKNLNKAKYLNECISKAIQNDESEFLSTLSKEELVQIILNKKSN